MAYPRNYKREVLEDEIDKMGDVKPSNIISVAHYSRGALGLTELQRRDSKVFGWWSLGISVLAVILSLSAVIFAYLAWHDSDQWRKEQLKILTEINQVLHSKVK